MRRGQRGTTALEFALILPVFVALFFGILDASWILWQKLALEAAVVDGCRTGALADPGQDLAYVEDVEDHSAEAIVARLEALGVPCEDCDILVGAELLEGQRSLRCSAERTLSPLVGFVPAAWTTSETLARMEVQR